MKDIRYACFYVLVSLGSAFAQSVSFGGVIVGATTSVQTLTYNFAGAATLSGVGILTEGATGLDYTDGGSSTCTAGTTYGAGQSCVVTVAFSPSAPGARSGAVLLFAQGSTVPLMTWYLNGVGLSGAVTIDPGSQSTIATLANNGLGSGLAIDGAGNFYVVDYANSQIIELGAGTFTQSTVISSGLSNPAAVALDGAGNLYISDTGNSRILMVPNEQGGLNVGDMSVLTVSGLGSPTGLACDGNGNIYVADAANGDVVEVPSGGGQPITVASGLASPQSVAVDSAGNVYVASSNQVMEFAAGGGAPIALGGGYNTPSAVAVDASGAVYVANSGNSQIVLVAPGGGSQINLPFTGISSPQGIAVDASANVYITASGNVYELNRTQAAALGFTSTNVGSTSTPQTLTVSDAGTQALTISNLATSLNFTQVPSGGADCTPSAQLASAGQCLIAVAFAPTISGPLTGSLTITDNSLNNPLSTQTVQLSGAGSQLPQTITFPTISTQTYGAGPITLSANASSGLPVSYTVTSGPASVSGNSLTIAGAGSVTVQASQSGNAQFAAAVPLSQTFTVNPGTQTISVTQPAPSVAPYNSSFTVVATANSGLPVSFSSSGMCTNVGATFTMTNSSGNCTVTASQPGNGNYLAAPTIQETAAAEKATPAVTFTGAPATAPYQSVFTVTATSNAGINPTITASGPCSISGSSVTMTGSTASCILTAKWPTNAYYLAASLTQTTTATKAAQVVTFTGAPASAAYQSVFTVAATSSVGITPTITAGGACSINSATVTMTSGTGTCTTTANWAANTYYMAATATQTTAAQKLSSVVTWATPAPITYPTALGTSQLNATANVPGGFVYSPVAGTKLNAGNQTLSVTFTPSQSSNYATATASVVLQVNQAQSVVTWNNPAAITYGTPLSATQLDATANVAGTFAYSPSAGTVFNAGAQTLSVQFTPTSSNYLASAASVTIQVNQASQTITFPSIPNQTYGTAPVSLNASASSGLPVSYAVTSGPASVSANLLTIVGGGSVTVQASQAGNGNYAAAAPLSRTFTVNPGTQTISFTQPAPSVAPYNGSFTVVATASSGLQVSFSSSGVCTNIGATFTMTSGTGTCTVTASQPGNANYLAAPTKQEITTAAKAAQVVTFTGAPASAAYQSVFTVAATSSAGITPTITAGGACSINSATVTMTSGTGTCTTTANWAANTQYLAASATQTTTAAKATPVVSFTGAPATAQYQSTFTVAASSSTGAKATITATGACSISGTTVTMKAGTGTCSLTANWAATNDYLAASGTQATTAEQEATTLTWATPAAITYPAPLSKTQLDATANVAGVFTYTPTLGTVLPAGSQTLSVQFTPSNSNYASSTDSVTLQVNASCSATYQTGASGPPNYGGVRNDTCTVTVGAIPSLWTNFANDYGYSGAGTVATNPMGLQILRVTDGNTDPAYPGYGYMNNADGGDDDQHWAIDHSMFSFTTWTSARTYVYAFNGSTMQATQIQNANGEPFTVPGISLAFGQTPANAHKIWVFGKSSNCTNTGPCAILQYDLSACLPGGSQGPTACNPPAPTTIYDFQEGTPGVAGANCLAGLDVTWFGSFRVSNDDTLFTMAFSNVGDQDTGTIVAGYQVGNGCRVWNTGTSTLNIGPTVGGIPGGYVVGEFPAGANTPQPMTMTGCASGYNCPGGTDQFTLHGATGVPPNYLIQMSANQCLAGSCTVSSVENNDSPYVWNFPTLESFSVGALANGVAGHECWGYNSLVVGENAPLGQDAFIALLSPGGLFTPSVLRSAGNNLKLIATGSLPATGSLILDTHCAWSADDATDTMPVLQSSTTVVLGNSAGQLNNPWTPANNKPNNGCVIPADITNSSWASGVPNCGAGNPFTGPLVNEVTLYQTNVNPGNATAGSACVTTNGSSNTPYSAGASSCTSTPPLRLGNSGISAVNPIFNAQNATIDWSPDGLYYTVTTDWWCTLGATTLGQDTICGGVEWQANTSYSVGDIITPSAGNTPHCTYTASGTPPLESGSVEPTGWGTLTGGVCPAQIPATGLDGNITWLRVGAIGQQNARYDVIVGSTSPE